MSEKTLTRLRRDEAVLLVVDIQERLVPAMFEAERIIKNCTTLIHSAHRLNLPIIVTVQNPSRLGDTIAPLATVLGEFTPIEKMRFSACTDETVAALSATGRKSVILCGLETHVCVLQTALDLIEQGFAVFVPANAVSSRYDNDRNAGLARMHSAGAIPCTTEMLVFELLQEAGTADFKALLPYIK
jgi:nicotinamidase-related amidase